MASIEIPLPGTFEADSFRVGYDPVPCPPPTLADVALGYEGALALNRLRYDSADKMLFAEADRVTRGDKGLGANGLPDDGREIAMLNVLAFNPGSGACLSVLTCAAKQAEGLALTAVDATRAGMAMTQHNLAQAARRVLEAPRANITQGDIYDPELWRTLGDRLYDVILCNPPYIPGHRWPGKLQRAVDAAPAGQADCKEYYRYILPRALGLLSLQPGASLLFTGGDGVVGAPHQAAPTALPGLLDAAVGAVQPNYEYTFASRTFVADRGRGALEHGTVGVLTRGAAM